MSGAKLHSRLLWFVALYLGGIAVVGLVAFILRAVLKA
jgi:hypothetical protein